MDICHVHVSLIMNVRIMFVNVIDDLNNFCDKKINSYRRGRGTAH